MKKIIKNIVCIFLLCLMTNCQEDSASFGSLNKPTNLDVVIDIVGKSSEFPNGDGSGVVKFRASANNAISYKYIFSDGTTQNQPGGVFNKRFTKTGINTYTVTIIASGKGGVSTNITREVTVLSNFSDDEAVTYLTGGSQKNWYWSASELGHLGVGPNNNDATKNYYADYYMAQPFEKAGSPSSSCLYENILTFSLNNGQLKYQLTNNGRTFFFYEIQND